MKKIYRNIEYIEIEEEHYPIPFKQLWEKFKPYVIMEIKYQIWHLFSFLQWKGEYLFGIGFWKWRFKIPYVKEEYSIFFNQLDDKGKFLSKQYYFINKR